MLLYYSPGACSLAVHIALRELDQRFDLVAVDLDKHTLPDGSDYRRVNPKGYVPLLELDDGKRLSEANVILQYLADRKPGSLAPQAGSWERYQLMEWLSFIATELHKGFGPLWHPQPREVREQAVARLGERFGFVATSLAKQPYLMGSAYTIADAYLFVMLSWAMHHKLDLKASALGEFHKRIASRAAVRAALEAEGLAK